MHKVNRFALKRKNIFIRAAAILIPLVIALLLLSQTVSAQTTYVIKDGSRVLVHTTTATDPEIVLGEAGLELGANDTYTTQASDGVSEISVRRYHHLTVNYYGEPMEVASQGETVEELLRRLNLTWDHTDVVSVPLDRKTYDGMEVTVSRVVRQDQTYTAVMPYKTFYSADAGLPEGKQQVRTKGEDGQALCTATVTYINGVETDRELLSQQVLRQPVDEIVAVGTGSVGEETEKAVPAMAEIGENTITLPSGEVLTYTKRVSCLATAYHCEGYVGTTATGTRARVGAIAVDPEVFPYGTRFYIVTRDGAYIYGVATAEDCGDKRFIYGTRLDLYFNTKYECVQFGARMCDVYILG